MAWRDETMDPMERQEGPVSEELQESNEAAGEPGEQDASPDTEETASVQEEGRPPATPPKPGATEEQVVEIPPPPPPEELPEDAAELVEEIIDDMTAG